METKLQLEIYAVLKKFPRYIENGILLKYKVISDLREYNQELIESLISNQTINKIYTVKVSNGFVFKMDEFITMLRYKSYWDNSYTKYSNDIGLSDDNKYLKYNTDVVLDFPHKDCFLEGGMSSEDKGKKEIYYHRVLARDEIDMLLAPKLLTNITKVDQDGRQIIKEFNEKDNLILKGNNLIALHSIKDRYAGKVKLIYIDPPYNTGGDSFKYNDRFNHATWLTFMKNRLDIAKQLLSNDGSIAISIDNNEIAYLMVLMDEIFGRENRKNIITVKRGSVTGAKVINPGVVNISEYVVIYSRDYSLWSPNRVYRTREWDKRYNQYILNYEKGYEEWEFATVLDMFAQETGIKKSQLKKHFGDEYESNLEEFVYKNSERIIRLAALDDNSRGQKAIELKKESLKNPDKIYFMNREDGRPFYVFKGNLILFVKDRMVNIDGKNTFSQPVTDIWDDVLPNDLHNEGGVELRKGKKPEKLISRLVELFTDENELVLDFFVGSGTTASVALKKNRKFIVIEQLDYIKTLTTTRLINTINGDKSGISKGMDWQGGGSFVYAELYQLNDVYVSRIQSVQSEEQVEQIITDINSSAFLDYKVSIDRLTNEDSGFATLSLEEKKKLLIESLDVNQMYLSYSEIDDAQYDIPETVKQFNHSFYQEQKKGGDE